VRSASAITIHRDPAGAWELAERSGRPGLPGVRRYLGFRERAAVPARRREVPTSVVTVVLSFATPYEVASAGPAAATGEVDRVSPLAGFLAPVSERPALTTLHGEAAGIQLDLEPVAARGLLGLPLAELPEPAVALADLFGPRFDLLAEELAGMASWERRFERVDRFLAARLAQATPAPASVAWAWDALRASGGRVAVGALADRLRCSRRHLVAGFRDSVGVAPKAAATILRFERAIRLLRSGRAGAGAGLAAVAAECGYFDQSHMNREFRRLAGVTPAAFARAAASAGLGVGEDEVTFVQDPAAAAS